MGDYYAWAASGLVAGLESSSEPDFGGSAVPRGEGAGNVRIASRMVERQRFMLRQRDGAQVEVVLINSGVALRNGHAVTVVWAARKGAVHGFPVRLDNHTTGAEAKLPHNIRHIRPKVSLLKTARFGLFATLPAAFALLTWVLIPGSLDGVDTRMVVLGAAVAMGLLFVVGLVIAKVVLDYLQADDDQKIWQAADEVIGQVRAAARQQQQRRPRA
ncbi:MULTISPECIES: hypothetical protein [Rhodomicrobium]|uniref:hypothetical protein n=1 Tax=Rhodomicrobium TaxID=1068 RepID=UPI000B4AC07C|nr:MULTISPECIES: hypothetical protein [Rhodomicrobium]